MTTYRPSAAVLFLALLLPDPARACTCVSIPKTYAERRLDYPAVFHGKVVATEVDETERARWIRFLVIKDYSADGSIVADTATVWTGTQSSACGEYFPVGDEALVFADNRDYSVDPPRPSGRLKTTSCSRNIRGAELPEALRGMEEAVGVRSRGPRAAPRARRAVIECGQVLFGGRVRADGALREDAGRP